jgi:small conductance mechanosensitive channel
MVQVTTAIVAAARAGSHPWYGHIGDSLPDFAISLAKALAILILTYLVAGVVAQRFRSGFERGGVPADVSLLFARVSWAVAWALGVMWAFYAVGNDLSPLAALIGVVGLALSLSLQSVLQNLVAGIYLLVERPFAIGDTIAVVGPNGANHEGRVEDIQMRTTHMRSRDNELILMPNAAIFNGVVTNRTAVGGYATHVTVTFSKKTDPEDARHRLSALLEALPSILANPAPNLRVDSVGEANWTGSLSFWVASASASSDAMWAIGGAFPEATVSPAATA